MRKSSSCAIIVLTVSIIALFALSPARAGFLHRSGTRLFDGTGSEVILTGANTESWLMFDPFWTDGIPISGSWNQPPADVPYTHTITAQIGQVTGDWIRVDDSNAAVSYDSAWHNITNYSANPGYLNSQHWSSTPGSSATFTFTGTQVRFFGYKRSDLGYARIFIDGALKATVDCYNTIPYYEEKLFEATGLPAGSHTLKIEVAATKNPKSTGTQVVCDAFEYGTAAAHGVEGIKQAWRDNSLSRGDIAQMKAFGLNSVRVVLDCRLFGTIHWTDGRHEVLDIDRSAKAPGFQYVDKLVSWCNEYHIYAILDMHCFVYGMTDDQRSLDSQVALWRVLAARYSKSPYVGGYDLWNEPNWANGSFKLKSSTNATIVYIHQRIIDAIRQVDKNHLIFLEGQPWDDRLDCFFYDPNTGALTQKLQVHDPADNIAFEFHRYQGKLPDKYDMTQDTGADAEHYNTPYLWSIQHQKKLASLANLPLWCGEAGYNQPSFLAKQMLLCRRASEPDDYGITAGMTLWCWKKSNNGSPFYYHVPDSFKPVNSYWRDLASAWKSKAPEPIPDLDPHAADSALYDYCLAANAERCTPSWQIVSFLNGNYVPNGSFEWAEREGPYFWKTDSPGDLAVSVPTAGAHNGLRYLRHGGSSAYQAYTHQTLTGLVDGKYNVSAWVRSSGGQIVAAMIVKGYAADGPDMKVDITKHKDWTLVSLPNIRVSNGQMVVGFMSNARANQWLDIDDVSAVISAR